MRRCHGIKVDNESQERLGRHQRASSSVSRQSKGQNRRTSPHGPPNPQENNTLSKPKTIRSHHPCQRNLWFVAEAVSKPGRYWPDTLTQPAFTVTVVNSPQFTLTPSTHPYLSTPLVHLPHCIQLPSCLCYHLPACSPFSRSSSLRPQFIPCCANMALSKQLVLVAALVVMFIGDLQFPDSASLRFLELYHSWRSTCWFILLSLMTSIAQHELPAHASIARVSTDVDNPELLQVLLMHGKTGATPTSMAATSTTAAAAKWSATPRPTPPPSATKANAGTAANSGGATATRTGRTGARRTWARTSTTAAGAATSASSPSTTAERPCAGKRDPRPPSRLLLLLPPRPFCLVAIRRWARDQRRLSSVWKRMSRGKLCIACMILMMSIGSVVMRCRQRDTRCDVANIGWGLDGVDAEVASAWSSAWRGWSGTTRWSAAFRRHLGPAPTHHLSGRVVAVITVRRRRLVRWAAESAAEVGRGEDAEMV